jgi:nucleoside 2-deoxyribosyltransferase
MEQNIRRAEALALECWRAGYATICPHSNTRFFQGAAPDGVWLNGDLEILRRCDALVLTPDWDRSSGARAEVSFALKHGIPVLHSVKSLDGFFHNKPKLI